MDGPIIGAVCIFGIVTLMLVIRVYSQTLQLQRKIDLIGQKLGIELSKPGELSERIKEIARDPGRTIAAIKAYREETGTDLADAKNAVEAYIRSQNS